jgi:hypothetical protein
MDNSTFEYWTKDGQRHEIPITPFLVPDGASLGPPHSVLSYDSEGMSPEPSEPEALAVLPAMVPQ